MSDTLYIFGCGGHARSIISSVKAIQSHLNIVLVDDNCYDSELILDCETMCERVFWENYHDREFEFIVGIGDNLQRMKKYEMAVRAGGIPRRILASSSITGLKSIVDIGSFVAEKTFLGPESKISYDSIINTGCVIEHETEVGAHTHCAPNTVVCGRCNIGNNVFLGAGSIVIDGITIADETVIGAGSVVVQNILERGTYAGCPARKIHD